MCVYFLLLLILKLREKTEIFSHAVFEELCKCIREREFVYVCVIYVSLKRTRFFLVVTQSRHTVLHDVLQGFKVSVFLRDDCYSNRRRSPHKLYTHVTRARTQLVHHTTPFTDIYYYGRAVKRSDSVSSVCLYDACVRARCRGWRLLLCSCSVSITRLIIMSRDAGLVFQVCLLYTSRCV